MIDFKCRLLPIAVVRFAKTHCTPAARFLHTNVVNHEEINLQVSCTCPFNEFDTLNGSASYLDATPMTSLWLRPLRVWRKYLLIKMLLVIIIS